MSYLPLFAQVYIVCLLFLVALFLGSGLNCLCWRMAHGEKWSSGRSKCPECGHTLSFWDLIPLFSWLFLKGKCRYCGKNISVRYPLSELTLGVLFVLLLYKYDLTLSLTVALVLTACLFCLSLVDMETYTIPNRFLVIPAVFRLGELLYTKGWGGVWYGVYHALALGGAVLVMALMMDKLLHKESIGGGDIKLLFMLGLFFDFPCCLLLLLLSCVIGLVVALCFLRLGKGTPFPFGPSLSMAAYLTLLIGQNVTSWYLGLF